jgi:hypothetical protein
MPATDQKKKFWLICRRLFRWLRVLCWLLLLALVGAFIYVNQVGIPNFIKQPILAELREHGLDLEFQRMRWPWYRGIVAEKVLLAGARRGGPQFLADEIEVQLNHDALKKFQLKVDSLQLRGGNFIWPLVFTNQSPDRFAVEKISTKVHFRPGDVWELESFQAGSLGVHFKLQGIITNASQLRDRFPKKEPSAAALPAEEKLRQVMNAVRELHFTQPPEIFLQLQADAGTNALVDAQLNCSAVYVKSRWAEGGQFTLTTQLRGTPVTNGWVTAQLHLGLDNAQTLWGSGRKLLLDATLRQPADIAATEVNWQLAVESAKTRWTEMDSLTITGQTVRASADSLLLDSKLAVAVKHLHTEWGDSPTVQLDASGRHSITNLIPLSADWELVLHEPATRWGHMKLARLKGGFTPRRDSDSRQADEPWAWWAKLAPYGLSFRGQFVSVQATNLLVDDLKLAAKWSAPNLEISALNAQLVDGKLNAALQLDVASRLFSAQGGFDFDAQRIKHFLTTNSQRWLNQYSWEKPPVVTGAVSLVLPAWTNHQPDWRAEVLPTLVLAGGFTSGPGAFRGVPAISARSHFVLSNMVWYLPDLYAERPEGRVETDYVCDTRTQDYRWIIKSSVYPQALEPVLEPEQMKAINYFQFTTPPAIEGELWGRWRERDRIGFVARVALTNFVVRGESCSNFIATVAFSNQAVHVLSPRVRHGVEHLSADGLLIDLPTQRLHITNGFGRMDVMKVTRAIGPKTAKVVEPYQFAEPPTVSVNGSLHLKYSEKTDLHFELQGTNFSWLRFRLPTGTTTMHWVTNTLVLTNFLADFYQGKLAGDAWFDFAPEGHTDYRFKASVTNGSLHDMVAGLALNPTNKLEGFFTGTLTVTNASTVDLNTWQGFGEVTLRDGLLWDAPIFSIFSPLLNSFSAGLGNSRAKEAQATFITTNGVIYTSDLVIHSPPGRLHYDGSVDFTGQVQALMEAEMFRDTWLVGPVIGRFWIPFAKLFKYKITGTLSNPKSEPLYLLPKVLLFPFHPFRTLKDLLLGSEEPAKDKK